MQTLLKNGLVYQADELTKEDILIEAGKIKAIGKNLAAMVPSADVIDVSGKLVTAGLVDVHVHYRDPGLTYKETITTGSAAAARGGYTTVCAMPNVKPVPDTPDKLSKMVLRNKKEGRVNIEQYSSITKELKSEELVDFVAMKKAGAFAFSNDGCGVQTAGTMYLAMQQAAKLKMAIVAHVEDNSLLFGGVMNAGKKADEFGLPGILGVSESSQIARDLLLAQKTGVHYHICHVSTKESVELVRLAKQHGINVTCEVSPHHLLLADADITENDGKFKMNPPLRSKQDQKALIEGLLDGTIDMIATDHAPHSVDEKTGDMLKAAFGITGSETAFALLYTKYVKSGVFKLEQLLKWMSVAPAKLFAIKGKGTLIPGNFADIAVFDLENQVEIKEEDFLSKGTNTPFIGEKVFGMTTLTFVSGVKVYQKEG